jgi:L-ribulose-5-phosphate 3-epimerase
LTFVHLGVMQGRLSPPVRGQLQAFPADSWRLEFELAASIGLQCIEWIYDQPDAGFNPLRLDSGLREIRDLTRRFNVEVSSVCADVFMRQPLLGATGQWDPAGAELLRWLIGRAGALGAHHIVLPFVDSSRLVGDAQDEGLFRLLGEVLPAAKAQCVELHLETDLPPDRLAAVISRAGDRCVRLTLDTGNSASLGFDAATEMRQIGKYIGSVHVKDRVRSGGSVPLGTGDADLATYLGALTQLGYDGNLILQAARGRSGDEIAWVSESRDIVLSLVKTAKGRSTPV